MTTLFRCFLFSGLLFSLLATPVLGWIAESPSGYTISSNLLVTGSVSVLDTAVSGQTVDLLGLVQQLQSQITALQSQLTSVQSQFNSQLVSVSLVSNTVYGQITTPTAGTSLGVMCGNQIPFNANASTPVSGLSSPSISCSSGVGCVLRGPGKFMLRGEIDVFCDPVLCYTQYFWNVYAKSNSSVPLGLLGPEARATLGTTYSDLSAGATVTVEPYATVTVGLAITSCSCNNAPCPSTGSTATNYQLEWGWMQITQVN